MTVELPKDAEGCEIPLDTALLYGKVSGEEYEVVFFNFRPSMRQWRVELKRRDDLGIYATENFTLSPPDTWEKLYEDLDKCIEADDYCRYYSTSDSTSGICAKCTRPDNDGCGCMAAVFSDIKKRIRKLSGED